MLFTVNLWHTLLLVQIAGMGLAAWMLRHAFVNLWQDLLEYAGGPDSAWARVLEVLFVGIGAALLLAFVVVWPLGLLVVLFFGGHAQ